MTSHINIVHSTPSLALRHGGPSYTVCALASAQQSLTSGAVHIVAGHLRTGEDALPSEDVTVHGINRRWPGGLIATRAKLDELFAAGNTVLHDQGIWHPQNLAACGYAAQHQRPYVISTHGMLEPWTLRHHHLRKKLARWLYQDKLLCNASCLMATADSELASIRAAGLNNPVAVIANGIDGDIPAPCESHEQPVRTLLFLSRIHPKKGLVHLIEAWQLLRPYGWQLRIVGPDEDNHRSVLQEMVDRHSLQSQISFHDAIAGAEKYQTYQQADAFVLPSLSENFGVVIAEALACGVPVITTNGTPWQEIDAHRCGWYIHTGTAALTDALRELFATTRTTLREMGQRGRQWMMASYQWPAIAAQNIAVYEWILGIRDRPSCVDVTYSSTRRTSGSHHGDQSEQHQPVQ